MIGSFEGWDREDNGNKIKSRPRLLIIKMCIIYCCIPFISNLSNFCHTLNIKLQKKFSDASAV